MIQMGWCRTLSKAPETLISMALVVSILACERTERVPPSQVAVRDSAGIVSVSVGPLVGVRAPEWRLDRQFATSRTGVEFFRVSAARLLSDGRVVVGDGGNHEVSILDSRGRLVTRVGRAGDGPGEFRGIAAVHPSAGGFAAYDPRLGRWTHFAADGGLIATEPMRPPNPIVDLQPLMFAQSGEVLAVYGSMRRFAREGIRRDTTPLLYYSEPEATPDTLSFWASDEWSYAPSRAGTSRTYVGFGRSLAASGRDSLAVLGETDSLNITVFGADGSVRMRIGGGGPRRPTTEEDGERWRELAAADLGASAPDAFRERLEEAPFHDSYPAFHSAVVDDRGRVWVGATAELDARERVWVVFGGDGWPVARMELPADVEVMDAAGGQVLVRETDDLGVQGVALYTVEERR